MGWLGMAVDTAGGADRAAYLEHHRGHEGLHSALLGLLFLVLIAAQIGLYLWKKYRYQSFQNVTLLGLWLIPFGFSLSFGCVHCRLP